MVVRYHEGVKSLRFIAIVLLAAIVCGPALFDPCLFDCHEAPASEARTPPCHDLASHDGLALTGASACDHDHDSLSADVVDVRVAAAPHGEAPGAAVLPQPRTVAAPALAGLPPVAPSASPHSRFRSLDLPLRL